MVNLNFGAVVIKTKNYKSQEYQDKFNALKARIDQIVSCDSFHKANIFGSGSKDVISLKGFSVYEDNFDRTVKEAAKQMGLDARIADFSYLRTDFSAVHKKTDNRDYNVPVEQLKIQADDNEIRKQIRKGLEELEILKKIKFADE